MSKELVTLESALAAIAHVGQHNGPGRAIEAEAMLVAAPPPQSFRWKELVDDAIAVLERHLPPLGTSEKDALNELVGIFDGTKYREIRDTNPVQIMALNGHQLEQALELIAPINREGVRDDQELEGELTFGVVYYKDGEKEGKGMCCWNSDTDGVLPLDEEPSSERKVAEGRIMSEYESKGLIEKVLTSPPLRETGKPKEDLQGLATGDIEKGDQGVLSIGRIVRNSILANSHPISADPIDGYLMFQQEKELDTACEQAQHAIASQWVTKEYAERLEEAVKLLEQALKEERTASSTRSRMRATALLAAVKPLTDLIKFPMNGELAKRQNEEFAKAGRRL